MTDTTICLTDTAGNYLGQHAIIDEAAGCPPGWVRAPVPEDLTGITPVYREGVWEYVVNPEAPPLPVPERISMLQAALALKYLGVYSELNEAIMASGDDTLILYWTRSTEGFERHHPSIEMVRAWRGWTSDEMDDMFRLAATMR
jgi:hypothetical protein